MSIGQGLDSLGSFFGFLVGRKFISMGPLQFIANPGAGGPLPAFMGRGSVRRLLSKSKFSRSFRKIESHLMLRVLCSAKIEHSRLINLRSASVSCSTVLVEIANGHGGRQLVPFTRELGGLVLTCARIQGHRISTKYK